MSKSEMISLVRQLLRAFMSSFRYYNKRVLDVKQKKNIASVYMKHTIRK